MSGIVRLDNVLAEVVGYDGDRLLLHSFTVFPLCCVTVAIISRIDARNVICPLRDADGRFLEAVDALVELNQCYRNEGGNNIMLS